MSFLDWPVECTRSSRSDHAKRRRVAADLLERFSSLFPKISYHLIWDSPLINAQAWRLGEARNVYLYGGLVRHPLIKKEGLALSLAHETGHHMGGEPRDPSMTWMTWQAQADHWAASIGMRAVFGDRARRLILRGSRQIAALESQIFSAGDLVSDLDPAIRLAVFQAALRGEGLPSCAVKKYELLTLQTTEPRNLHNGGT